MVILELPVKDGSAKNPDGPFEVKTKCMIYHLELSENTAEGEVWKISQKSKKGGKPLGFVRCKIKRNGVKVGSRIHLEPLDGNEKGKPFCRSTVVSIHELEPGVISK